MREFNSININGQRYDVPGFCGKVSKTIVIDCDELISMFEIWRREGTVVSGIHCYRFNSERLSSNGKYIVDVTNGNEAEFFPVR